MAMARGPKLWSTWYYMVLYVAQEVSAPLSDISYCRVVMSSGSRKRRLDDSGGAQRLKIILNHCMIGDEFEVDLLPSDSLYNIKLLVQQRWNMSMGDIRLLHGVACLEDDSKSLADLGAVSGWRLSVVKSRSAAAEKALEWLCCMGFGHDEATTQVLDLAWRRTGTLGFYSEWLKLLATALAGYYSDLRQLDISENVIGPFGAHALAPGLQTKVKMQTLNLRDCRIHVDGAKALAPSFEKMVNMQNLNLQDNHIGQEGAQALAPSFEKMTNMQILNLRNNSIRYEGVQALAPSFAKMTSMQSLDLNCFQVHGPRCIGAKGAEALAPSLVNMTNMRILSFSGWKFGPEGATALAPALAKMTKMEHLDLNVCSIGPVGAQVLAPVLQRMVNMRSLSLRCSDIGPDGAKALAPALVAMPRLRILDMLPDEIGVEFGQLLFRLRTDIGLEIRHAPCFFSYS